MKPKMPITGKSLAKSYSELAKHWHPTKNKNLTPNDVSHGSSMQIWWKCPKDDDMSGMYLFAIEKQVGRSVLEERCQDRLILQH